MTLDGIPIGRRATISGVDWTQLSAAEAQRLRTLGIDEGATVQLAHRGVLGGADPLAINIGRMTVAMRLAHARTIQVELNP